MDTSKAYIKMCKAAVGLQNEKWVSKKGKSYPWEEGDMVSLHRKVFMYDACSHSEGFIEPQVYDTECVWLPRQDQLQEMVIESLTASLHDGFEHRRLIVLTGRFREFVSHCFPEEPLYSERFDSMEQLWLAFVMKEKHGKVWNGTAWENSGKGPQE